MQKFNQNQENIQNFEQSSLEPQYKQPQIKPPINRKVFETEQKAMENQNDRQYHRVIQPPLNNVQKSNRLVLKSQDNQLCEFPLYYDFLAINRFHDKLIKNSGNKDNDEDTSYSEVEYFKEVCVSDVLEGKIQNPSSDEDQFKKEKPKKNQKAPRRNQGKKKKN